MGPTCTFVHILVEVGHLTENCNSCAAVLVGLGAQLHSPSRVRLRESDCPVAETVKRVPQFFVLRFVCVLFNLAMRVRYGNESKCDFPQTCEIRKSDRRRPELVNLEVRWGTFDWSGRL